MPVNDYVFLCAKRPRLIIINISIIHQMCIFNDLFDYFFRMLKQSADVIQISRPLRNEVHLFLHIDHIQQGLQMLQYFVLNIDSNHFLNVINTLWSKKLHKLRLNSSS